VAEELVFGVENVTTGAANDIERATSLARSMVTKWGLTEKLGPMTYSEDEDEVFLGRSVTQHKHMSDDTARLIDEEVRRIVDNSHDRARDLLTDHRNELEMMAAALMKYETIDGSQIDQIMEGHEPDPPEDWSDSEPGPEAPNKDDADKPSTIGGPAEQL
jgi:cell division protease FtsH